MCLCLCREEWSYLISLEPLAGRNLLCHQVLRPGLVLPVAPAGLSVLESLRCGKSILKSDTGTLKTLGEALPPNLQLRSCLDGAEALLEKGLASIQARNACGLGTHIQV